ncbi:hypothetical protein PCANC_27856 [Puccinia coronata f. sp. avenae]|uniref:Uncharacterized protein n=1 Tax=Puccinia coronata f. sp. avenae TaxID=200324 RepID=A0A2N5TQL9_9BASI|nr:hypothetical protein PCANC_27856 [Puccinia coronata f. sp. avenae]
MSPPSGAYLYSGSPPPFPSGEKRYIHKEIAAVRRTPRSGARRTPSVGRAALAKLTPYRSTLRFAEPREAERGGQLR